MYFHTIHGEKPRLSIAPTPSSLLFKRLSCDFHTKKKIIGIGMDIFDPDFAIGEHLYYTRKQEKKQEMSRNDIQKIRGREKCIMTIICRRMHRYLLKRLTFRESCFNCNFPDSSGVLI